MLDVNLLDAVGSQRKSLSGIGFPYRSVLIRALAILVASFSACSGWDSKQQQAHAAAPRPVSVSIAPVQKQDMPVYLSGLGSVTAFNTANIKSRVDGQIMQVAVKEGQTVRQGQLLIEIDSRPFQVQLEQAQAQLSRDQAQLGDAKLNLDRDTALIPSGSISQQQVDTQRALVHQVQWTGNNDQPLIANANLQLAYGRT